VSTTWQSPTLRLLLRLESRWGDIKRLLAARAPSIRSFGAAAGKTGERFNARPRSETCSALNLKDFGSWFGWANCGAARQALDALIEKYRMQKGSSQ
jgi:hypothetical protein